VLVVDDNKDSAEMFAASLAALGHETRVALDGPDALAVARAFQPQLALLDIGLPVMDGYELGRRLRGAPETRDVGLVALTGYGQERDRAASEAAGFDAHLVKPVTIETVQAMIDDLIGHVRRDAPSA
jgi:CheY-like chemotaxis protein